MKRLLTLVALCFLAACVESPTQPSDAGVELLSTRLAAHGGADRATVSTTHLFDHGCEELATAPGVEVCVEQSARLHRVDTSSGVTSFSVTRARLLAEFIESGVVVQTQRQTDRVHELVRNGDMVQFHQRLCLEVVGASFTFDFGFRVNVANGEERRYVETTRGCRY